MAKQYIGELPVSASSDTTKIPLSAWVELPAVQYEEALVLRITASGDFRSTYSVGDRIKLTQSSTVKQFIITQLNYSTGYTYFVLNGNGTTLANSAITLPYYSHAYSPTEFDDALRKNQLITDVKAVDGTGSGLDADTVDGSHASAFATVGTTIPIDGWIPQSDTWSYVSSTTFTINADVTGIIQKGDKIKFTQTTVKYFYVVGVSAYSGGYTTITVTGGEDYTVANAAITSPYYSHVENPFGFVPWFGYIPSFTGFSSSQNAVCRFKIIGKTCFLNIKASLAGTSNATTFTMSLPVLPNTTVSRSFTSLGYGQDNGSNVYIIGTVYGYINSTDIVFSNGLTGTWTNSGTKYVDSLQIAYEIV